MAYLLQVAFALLDDQFHYLHHQVVMHVELFGDLEDKSCVEHIAYFFGEVGEVEFV